MRILAFYGFSVLICALFHVGCETHECRRSCRVERSLVEVSGGGDSHRRNYFPDGRFDGYSQITQVTLSTTFSPSTVISDSRKAWAIVEPENQAELIEVDLHSGTSRTLYVDTPSSGLFTAPVLVGDRIIFGAPSGDLVSISQSTGRLLAKTNLLDSRLGAGEWSGWAWDLCLGAQTVILHARDGTLYGLSSGDARIRWRTFAEVTLPQVARPVTCGDVVVLPLSGICVNASSGKRELVIDGRRPVLMSSNDRQLFLADDALLDNLDHTSIECWSIGEYPESKWFITYDYLARAMSLGESRLYVAGVRSSGNDMYAEVVCIDIESGQILWRRRCDNDARSRNPIGLAATQSVLYLAFGDSLYRIDANGEIIGLIKLPNVCTSDLWIWNGSCLFVSDMTMYYLVQ